MITEFRIQNYKALRDVTVALGPIHVLIGPNDTGKTSILEAIAALCRSVDHELPEAFMGSWEGRSLVWHGDPTLNVVLSARIGEEPFTYTISCQFPNTGRNAKVTDEALERAAGRLDLTASGQLSSQVYRGAYDGRQHDDVRRAIQSIRTALQGVHYYRWVPRMLALPVAPHSARRFRMEQSGFGLALALDDILGYDRERFTSLENRFRAIFPQIRSIKLIAQMGYKAPVDDPRQVPMLSQSDGKGLYFEFADSGVLLPASQVSDGMLLVLAYLTVLYLPQPPRMLLVEEPENGVHPKRLADVLTILRELVTEQSHTQVLLTTHSPYVVDQFKPEEVSLCQKERDGSVSVHRLSESRAVREQLDVFTLGEIWTAEGDEALVAREGGGRGQ